MAISAIAHIMRITKPQLLELRDKCILVSEEDTDGQYQMKRSGFLFAMKEMNVADEPDYQILEKLFIMWNKDNKDLVDTVSSMFHDEPDKMSFSLSTAKTKTKNYSYVILILI